MTELERQVYSAVCSIPAGYVSTYGQIARLLGNAAYSRAVGNALHRNPDRMNIPCHRVVSSCGKLSESFAFGGFEGQRQRLEAEGVIVVGKRVDLAKYLWYHEENI